MDMISIGSIHPFLSSFFALFNARVDRYRIDDKKVLGNIVWKDKTEGQEFSWQIDLNEVTLNQLKLLCDFLAKYNLIDGDKIIIDETELKARLLELGWGVDVAQRNIDDLCAIELKMIDNGVETDSFFIHF